MLAHIQMARFTYAALIERLQWQVTPTDGPKPITEKIDADKTAGLNVQNSGQQWFQHVFSTPSSFR